MKRFIVLFVLISSFVLANPIDASPTINEIQIISPNDWFIELCVPSRSVADLDSIFIENLSGKAKVEFLDSSTVYPVITPDCLSDSLLFSRDADSITIHIFGYSRYSDYSRSMVIGDYPGSCLHHINANQSLVYDMEHACYYKTNTPTPGDVNTDEYTGKIYGHFYDKDGMPIRDMYFLFYNIMWKPYEYIDSTGYYEAEKPSQYYYHSAFQMHAYGENSEVWNFQPVEFDLEPGDSIQVDFYSLQSSIIPVIRNTIKFNNYPHPASTYSWFFIENTEIEASAMRVNVYALNGRKVDSFVPSARQFRYDCSDLPQGSYIMTLQHGHEVLASKKLHVLK